MKLPITIAAICALTASASSISEEDITFWYKKAPASLRKGDTRVDRDKEETGYDYSLIPIEKCKSGA